MMKRIAKTQIEGPEASGEALLYETEMNFVLQLPEMDIVPGAPDVYLGCSPRSDGHIDEKLKDISMLGYHTSQFEFMVEKSIDFKTNSTLIVYCKEYTAHFGHGTLEFEIGNE